jgi:hypothetical protein
VGGEGEGWEVGGGGTEVGGHCAVGGGVGGGVGGCVGGGFCWAGGSVGVCCSAQVGFGVCGISTQGWNGAKEEPHGSGGAGGELGWLAFRRSTWEVEQGPYPRYFMVLLGREVGQDET